MKRSSFVAAIAAAIVTTSPAFADESGETQAQALFDDAKQLILKGRWAEACPMLARSNELDPRPTTLFRLAECYENTGKKASAWNAYIGSAAAASAAGEAKRAEFARERAKRIEATLSHLVITVNQRPLTLYEDGARIDEARWGTKIPIDPGEHVVSADAPGKQRFTAKVVVLDAATTVLTIPPLLDLPAPAAREARAAEGRTTADRPPPPTARAPAEAPPTNDNRTLRRWSIILAGVGLASVGTGAAFSLTAPDSPDGCRGTCVVGTGLMIGGGLLAATGLAFFLASFGDSSSGARVSTRAHPLELRF